MFLQLKWSVFEWFSRGFMILNKFMNLMMDSLVRVSFPLRTIDPLFFPVFILADEVASVKLNRSSKIGIFVINGYWNINFAMSATKNGFFLCEQSAKIYWFPLLWVYRKILSCFDCKILLAKKRVKLSCRARIIIKSQTKWKTINFIYSKYWNKRWTYT